VEGGTRSRSKKRRLKDPLAKKSPQRRPANEGAEKAEESRGRKNKKRRLSGGSPERRPRQRTSTSLRNERSPARPEDTVFLSKRPNHDHEPRRKNGRSAKTLALVRGDQAPNMDRPGRWSAAKRTGNKRSPTKGSVQTETRRQNAMWRNRSEVRRLDGVKPTRRYSRRWLLRRQSGAEA